MSRPAGQAAVAIIDYGSGNLRSAQKAFERAAAQTGRGAEIVVTADPEQIRSAERIVLPGVGAFGDCLKGLTAVSGLRSALEAAVLQDKTPFLGICVGMQLLARMGHEHGAHQGLGWIDGEVCLLTPTDGALKIPHMGWNELIPARAHALLEGIEAGQHAYFVHSYHFKADAPQQVLARTDYGGPIAAVIASGNIAGTQFHPEKSQATGLRLLANFLSWQP